MLPSATHSGGLGTQEGGGKTSALKGVLSWFGAKRDEYMQTSGANDYLAQTGPRPPAPRLLRSGALASAAPPHSAETALARATLTRGATPAQGSSLSGNTGARTDECCAELCPSRRPAGCCLAQGTRTGCVHARVRLAVQRVAL